MKLRQLLIISVLALFSSPLLSQNFLNGSFEVNTAGTCDFNMTNASFNTKMSNCSAYGLGGELDIFQSSCGYGSAQSGNWMVGLATPGAIPMLLP
jgi:hypothetical protein